MGEHLLCKQGVVGSNPTVSMGDGCGLRAISFPGFQKNRSSFVLWFLEGAVVRALGAVLSHGEDELVCCDASQVSACLSAR